MTSTETERQLPVTASRIRRSNAEEVDGSLACSKKGHETGNLVADGAVNLSGATERGRSGNLQSRSGTLARPGRKGATVARPSRPSIQGCDYHGGQGSGHLVGEPDKLQKELRRVTPVANRILYFPRQLRCPDPE